MADDRDGTANLYAEEEDEDDEGIVDLMDDTDEDEDEEPDNDETPAAEMVDQAGHGEESQA
jgi:hypothetical protein